MTAAKQRPSPRSTVRLLQLLQMLADHPEGLSLATLSRRMTPPTPKSSVLNLLRSLVSNAYVEQVDNGYRLARQSYRLASSILAHRTFPEVAKPMIRKLVAATGETALIAVLSDRQDSIVYIDKVESPSSLRFSATIGDRRPLYCTAGGITFLAHQKPQWIKQFLNKARLQPLTKNTLQSKRRLLEAIENARKTGVALTHDQATDGVTGIAVPIFDSSNEIIAALVLAAPSARISERLAELSQLVRTTGSDISAVMGATRTS